MPGPADNSLRLYCPACKQTYRVRNADSAKKYSCQSCKGVLQLMGDTSDTMAINPAARAPDESAPTVIERPQNSVPGLKPLDDDDLKLQGESSTPQAPDVLRLLPKSFQGYTIVKELARGGMGAVLLADQTELRRKIAMKVILPWAGTIDPAIQDRFMREARAMAKLKHPHIIQIHDVGAVNGLSFLAMEFIEGETLADAIAANKLNFTQLVALLSKVARALAYAHSLGVIHRDIKPANIMIRTNGEPVLMDFGLAKDFDANTMKLSVTGNIMGTPSYMSPEQAQALPVDERSDLYSLGAVLYECLTREAPFEGETTIATIYNVVHKRARPASEIRPNVPPDLSRICMKALEKDPADRYQRMDEFAADLDRFSAGMVITAKGPSIVRKTVEFSRAHRASYGGIIAAVCILALVGLVLKMGWLRFGKNSAQELRASLTNGSIETRVLHVKALGGDLREKRIAPGTAEYRDAIDALRQAASDTDPSGAVATAALEVLTDVKDTGADEILRQRLKPDQPANVRRSAVDAVKKLNPQGLTSILKGVIKSDPDLQIRIAAVEAMPEVVPADVMVYLISLSVKNDPPALGAAANRKLALLRPPESILALYTGGATVVAAQKVSGMIDATRAYEQQLEEAMGEVTPNKSATKKPPLYELAAKKLLDTDAGVRLQAAFDLGLIGDTRAEPALIRTLLDSDADVALAAAESLGKLPKLEAPEKLTALIKDSSPSARRAVARAHGLVRPVPPGQPLASVLLTETIAPVQSEIATALGRMKFTGAVTPLLTVLNSGSTDSARKAAWALGQIGDKSACPELVNALARATDKDLRAEIAGALSAITGKAIGPDEAGWRKEIK